MPHMAISLLAQPDPSAAGRWLRRYGRAAVIFEEGDPPDAVFLLTKGLVKLLKYSPREEPLTLEIIVPGGLFGVMAVMDHEPYPVSAETLQAGEAYRIPAADFHSLMREKPAFAGEAYRQLGEHVRHAQAMRSLARESVEKRLAFLLALLADSIGPELRLRREDLSGMVGSTPETAVRVLNEFRRRRLISAGWKRVTVLDPAGLRKIVS